MVISSCVRSTLSMNINTFFASSLTGLKEACRHEEDAKFTLNDTKDIKVRSIHDSKLTLDVSMDVFIYQTLFTVCVLVCQACN